MRISLWLLWLPLMSCQDSSGGSSSNLLGPGDFHYHPYQSEQYLKEVEPTKKGPVVFPNDGPPPSKKPPLIVTSRPLIESIRRSELNPEPENNTLSPQLQDLDLNDAEYSDYDSKPQYSKFKPDVQRFHPDKFKKIDELQPHFRLKQGFLKPIIFGRTKDYKPFVYPVAPDAGFLTPHNAPDDYEDHSGLPPIYKAIADHAKLKAQGVSLNLKKHLSHPYVHPAPHPPPQVYDYHQVHQTTDPRPGIRHHHPESHLPLQRHRHHHFEDDYPSDYAFSYKVRDHLTGDDFSHSQHSSGSATNGEYRVRLPDGRMQIVKYTADHNGYKADVRYDDEDKMKGTTLQTHDDYKFGGGKHDHGTYNTFDDNTINNDRIYEDYKPNYKVAIATQRPPQPQQIEYKNYNHDFNLINSDYFSKNDYKEDNNISQNQDYQPIVVSENYKPVKESREEYNQYTDLSNEYNRDYSLEYDGKNDNFEPHQSKFSSFTPSTPKPEPSVTPTAISSTTVRPLYEELKQIFVTNNPYHSPERRDQVDIKVPSTTPASVDYDTTTEHVVVIGTKPLYTNVLNSVTPTQSYQYTTPNDLVSNLTPSGYLVSTIANLKKGEKPVLSSRFIDRINKYITFT